MLRQRVPKHVRSDNGAEMRADRVRKWLASLVSQPLFIEPGRPALGLSIWNEEMPSC
jgi:putative transposase